MKFLIKDLKAYIIIALSVAYAGYTTSVFLNSLIDNQPVSILSAVALSIIAHLYLVEGTKDLKVNKFNSSFLVAILLCGSVVYFDLSGVSHLSKIGHLIPVNEQYEGEDQVLIEQINSVQKVLIASAEHTKLGKTNWALYNTYNKSQEQLKSLKEQQQELKASYKDNILRASVNAGEQENQMIGISIILFVLSCLVSFSLHPTVKVKEINIEKVSSTPSVITGKTKSTTTNVVKNTPTVEEILQGILGDKDSKNSQGFLNLFKSQDRIRIAAAYISKWGTKDHRILSEKFHLNFSQISKAKIMANKFLPAQQNNPKEREAVGFTW